MSTGRLHLPDQARQAILAHAAWCAPDECCGLIAVDRSGMIRFTYPLTNSAPSPTSYTVDPDEHFHAMTHAEANGWEIGGVFHSHPRGAASPSDTDISTALDPGWLYLITDLNQVRAFAIDGEVMELEVLAQ
jgi:[CysO sulfur-carrier protein]-S-L-cysteine hydrolase